MTAQLEQRHTLSSPHSRTPAIARKTFSDRIKYIRDGQPTDGISITRLTADFTQMYSSAVAAYPTALGQLHSEIIELSHKPGLKPQGSIDNALAITAFGGLFTHGSFQSVDRIGEARSNLKRGALAAASESIRAARNDLNPLHTITEEDFQQLVQMPFPTVTRNAQERTAQRQKELMLCSAIIASATHPTNHRLASTGTHASGVLDLLTNRYYK